MTPFSLDTLGVIINISAKGNTIILNVIKKEIEIHKEIKKESIVKSEELKFYSNYWFWIAICLLVILILSLLKK